jgi:hypothetical protein
MNALPFTAAAMMVMLPGLVSLFKLLSDDPKVAMPQEKRPRGCSVHDRVKAAAQAITQANQQVVAV